MSQEERSVFGDKVRQGQKKSGKVGGLRRGSGLGKKGWYQGFWCDSTWELAWILYHLDRGLHPTRNREGFGYVFEGKPRKYYPDFILDGRHHEIKGFLRPSDSAKIQAFPGELILWGAQEMKVILDYCFNKYGKDLALLYE